MILSRALLEKKLEPSNTLAEIAQQCTMCGYCKAICALKNTEILQAFRELLVEKDFFLDTHLKLVEHIKKVGSPYKKSDFRRDGKHLLFLGCEYRASLDTTKKIISVLNALNLDVKVVEEICCGYILHALGFTKQFKSLKNQFQEIFPQKSFYTICPTCTAFFREEYRLSATHVLKFIADNLDKFKFNQIELSATYHDPCHLGRLSGLIDEPRKILKKLGIKIIEMQSTKYFSACCGGGSALKISYPELAEKIAENRVKEALEVSNQLITSCIICEKTLMNAAIDYSEEHEFLEVLSIWDILYDAIQ
jgi:Fe-S oxidoreductase